VWLAASPQGALTSGRFWHDRRPRATHRVPWTRESESDREELWRLCMDAGGPNSPAAEEILARRAR